MELKRIVNLTGHIAEYSFVTSYSSSSYSSSSSFFPSSFFPSSSSFSSFSSSFSSSRPDWSQVAQSSKALQC